MPQLSGDARPPLRAELRWGQPPCVLSPPPGPWGPLAPLPQTPAQKSPETLCSWGLPAGRLPAPRLPLLVPAGAAPRAHKARSPPLGPLFMRTFQNPPYSHSRLSPHTPQRSLPQAPGGATGCLEQSKLATPPLRLQTKAVTLGKVPRLLSSGISSGLGLGSRLGGTVAGTAICYWLLTLSCWYRLCSRTACSNRGRFIPSTQVSTRALTTEPPSERHKREALAVTDPRASSTPHGRIRLSPRDSLSG